MCDKSVVKDGQDERNNNLFVSKINMSQDHERLQICKEIHLENVMKHTFVLKLGHIFQILLCYFAYNTDLGKNLMQAQIIFLVCFHICSRSLCLD
jgi:hypothetical protein